MEAPINKYQTNTIYGLSNQYYIDLIVQDNGTTLMVIKSPEGAPYSEKVLGSGDVSNSQNLKAIINSEITFLSEELNVGGLEIVSIDPKIAIPPRKNTNSFRIKGRIVTKEGDPLENAKITPFFLTKESISATYLGAGTNSTTVSDIESVNEGLTNFEDTIVGIGAAALILDPAKSGEDGSFVLEFRGDENIDFEKSYITINKQEFFPKQVGPNIGKSGEEFVNIPKPAVSQKFEGPTQTLNEKLIQQEDKKYRAEIELKALELGVIVIGAGISQDREIAKKKARSDAEKQLALKSQEISEESDPSSLDEDKIKFDIYDVGRVILKPLVENIEEKVTEVKIKIQEVENKLSHEKALIETSYEQKLVNIYNTKKETIKRALIPVILGLIAEFGPGVLNSLIGGQKNPFKDAVCLPADKLQKVLDKRNKLTRQINNLYKTVRVVSKILKVTNIFIIGLQLATNLAKGLQSIPGPVSPPFVGLKDLWNPFVEGGYRDIERILTKAGFAITNLNLNVAVLGFFLGYMLELLNNLDELIRGCAEKPDLEGGFTLSFDEVNVEINSFKDPLSPQQNDDIIDPLTDKPFPYQGFTFEIKNDTSQNFQYPKRYAIARNVQGIQVLRSESSFASNPSVLIEELKFVIDRDNLRAD